MSYFELKSQQAPCDGCWFAFSDQQFNEGKAKADIGDAKIYSAGHGLYGTREGIQKFMDFYDAVDKQIADSCDPQEVYNYEFSNHECGYTCDDRDAFAIVVRIFGPDIAANVKRKYQH